MKRPASVPKGYGSCSFTIDCEQAADPTYLSMKRSSFTLPLRFGRLPSAWLAWVGLLGWLGAGSACQPSAPVSVAHVGSLHTIMMENQTGAQVQIDTLLARRDHLWGLGAATDLQGEWLIWAGEPHLSRVLPDSQAPKLAHTRGSGETATLLVWSQVKRWERGKVPADLTMRQLGQWMADQASLHQLPIQGPFPIRLSGPVADLRWHVIARLDSLLDQAQGHAAHMRYAQRGRLVQDSVQIFGFFSTQHERVFTHMGEMLHLHAYFAPGNAHIDTLRTGAGMTIWWPAG